MSQKNLPVIYDGRNKQVAIKGKLKKKIKSVFAAEAPEILEAIQLGKNQGAITLIYKRLLMMMVTLLPVAERVVRQTKGYKGIYQINMMVSGMRELLADLQATQDRGALGRSIAERYIRPAFLDIAKQIVETHHRMKLRAGEKLSKEDRDRMEKMFDKYNDGLGEYINLQYKELVEHIIKALT